MCGRLVGPATGHGRARVGLEAERTMAVVVTGEVYAHISRGMLCDGRSLTLVDPSPSMIWLSLEPVSGLGYVPTGAFLDLWADPARLSDHRARRVRGRLALLGAAASLAGDATLVVGRPRVTASGLTYDVEVLEGMVPASSGACVLFLEWNTAPRFSR